MTATFSKSERLCSKTGIDELFANGETHRLGVFTVKFLRISTSFNNQNIVADAVSPAQTCSPCQTTHTPPKILISVPKRYIKRAVNRNRTKRLIREIYRKNKAEYLSETNIHSLAIIYTSSKVPDYALVEECLLKLLRKIK